MPVRSCLTLKSNGLVEIETITDVSSRLVVNRASLKTRATVSGAWLERFQAAVEGGRDAA